VIGLLKGAGGLGVRVAAPVGPRPGRKARGTTSGPRASIRAR